MFLPGAIYLLINNYIPMAGIIINMVIGIMFAIFISDVVNKKTQKIYQSAILFLPPPVLPIKKSWRQ